MFFNESLSLFLQQGRNCLAYERLKGVSAGKCLKIFWISSLLKSLRWCRAVSKAGCFLC